jgi:hypothetical protein
VTPGVKTTCSPLHSSKQYVNSVHPLGPSTSLGMSKLASVPCRNRHKVKIMVPVEVGRLFVIYTITYHTLHRYQRISTPQTFGIIRDLHYNKVMTASIKSNQELNNFDYITNSSEQNLYCIRTNNVGIYVTQLLKRPGSRFSRVKKCPVEIYPVRVEESFTRAIEKSADNKNRTHLADF